ncbi:hypothetical protein ACEPAF_9109 [Sanghuangporus sanghuang]
MMNGNSTNEPRRRVRPKLSIGVDGLRSAALKSITIDTDPSPVVDVPLNGVADAVAQGIGKNTDRSSPSSSSSSSSPLQDALSIGSDSEYSDDMSKNLEELEKLRRNVHKNLRLRPLRSGRRDSDSPGPGNGEAVFDAHRSESPALTDSSAPSPALSVYYTPTSELRTLETPSSARFIGNINISDNTLDMVNTPVSSFARHRTRSPPVGDSMPSASGSAIPLSSPPIQAIDADGLLSRLGSSHRPLLIDTRPLASYLSCRIQHSLNIAIPSLILRRCKKPGSGLPSLEALRTYITTDGGKRSWDDWIRRVGPWSPDVVVYDDEMDEDNRGSLQVPSWAILSLLQSLIGNAAVLFLKGGIAAVRSHSEFHHHIIAGEENQGTDSGTNTRISDGSQPKGKGGLFQLDTQTAARSKVMPQIEPPSTSPGPLVSSSNHNMLCDLTPSPSPSTCSFPHHAKPRKCSIPNLRRLDTSSAERLIPKLSVRTMPIKSNTLAAPVSMSRQSSSSSLRSTSSFLGTKHVLPRSLSPPSMNGSTECLSPNVPHPDSFAPRSPITPMGGGIPSSPVTARPDYDQPPSTEDPLPSFTISTILPNFLYLGPEPASPEHVDELLSLGVKRILNIAIECDDDQGLRLREKFERYTRIPMRDIVEEENVARSVREACEALDDARLHSAPTYVHCKAGKSRSVTAVIAYLIHANHWTLSRAYAFVTERRKGISPNIGFVSELMTFEEQELGGKSVGVVNPASAVDTRDGSNTLLHSGAKTSNFGYTPGVRRNANLRESLPPLVAQNSEMVAPGQLSAGGLGSNAAAHVGNAGQEVEIKDASGRYRHARRAPVDENTLQPMRRVSKAGLESAMYSFSDV